MRKGPWLAPLESNNLRFCYVLFALAARAAPLWPLCCERTLAFIATASPDCASSKLIRHEINILRALLRGKLPAIMERGMNEGKTGRRCA